MTPFATELRLTRVLLADDHEIVRAGLRRLLSDSGAIEFIAEASSGEQAYSDYGLARPDVVILDLAMPGIGGIEAARRIIAKDPGARILVLSMYEEPIFAVRALQAGAKGFVTKRCAPEMLLAAVSAVARGETFVEPGLAKQIAIAGVASGNDPMMGLTEREFEVFRMLAEGKTVLQISRTLLLSDKTVSTYQTRILRKLGVQNSAELARLAIRRGLIQA